ncbi:MAG: BON domain-containing protein [Candidatus Paracaedimonas acanthamoebae]|uniref:BON domain-containing protein n=1 Tax=Candidatus Paracaedimonas acanthamoebae TaxID=244581 RepID=A0A8J7TSS1_9PROT|nr:BON domain-containing protein [Candidatus Paracaedimonas acanthamoebae]
MKNKTIFSTIILTTVLTGTLLTGCAVFHDRETPGEYIDDSGKTANIKSLLIAEPSLNATEIHVDTFKDTVQLSGFVKTREQANTAERIARQTKGIKKIINNIKVQR